MSDWTIRTIMEWAVPWLEKREGYSSRVDVENLLSECLGMARIELYANYDRPLSVDDRGAFKEMIRRRGEGEPVAYILGYKWFYNSKISVNSDVLIPRSDTEVLVEEALSWSRKHPCKNVLDLCSGSGCISLALAQENSGLERIEGWDLSSSAIEISRKTAIELGVADRTSFKEVDVLELEKQEGTQKFDMVVCNPPYIAYDEKADLSKSVLDFEPHMALFAEEGGLKFYRKVANSVSSILRLGGRLYFEVGYQQGEEVAALLERGSFKDIEVRRDYSGHQRVVSATLR